MKNLEKVIACLKHLGMKPDIESFEHRLIIQKAVYLLQLKGVRTGFSYGLYVRGPYSPELAKELYENKAKLKALDARAELSQKELKAAEELKELFGLKPGLLEVASTYAYFAFEKREPPLSALKNVRRLKPFSESQIALGVSKAKEYLYAPTEKEIAEMKKEFSAWEGAALESVN